MTLSDLLASDVRPGLALLSGGPDALHRPVRGIHSTEMEHPAMWVERDWVLLTSGLALKRQPDKQRRLVAELDDAGLAALGFGIGSAFSVVPPAMLDEARRRDFPIFAVPWDVSFRDMIRDVYEGLLSHDVRGYQRLLATQHYLLDALADEAPQETVLARLSELVNATAAVIAPHGRVVRATGALPTNAIWEELSQRSPMVTEFDAGGSHCVAVPLADNEARVRWLVVATLASSFTSPLTKRIVQITAPLLSAMSRIDAVARGQERQVRSSLLEALIEHNGVDERTLEARALALGVRLEGAARALAAKPADPSSEDAEALLEQTERTLDGVGATGLLAVRDGWVAMVVDLPQGDAWPEVLAELHEALGGATIAAGRPIESVADVPRSYTDARLALQSGRGGAMTYEQLDLDAMMVGEIARERWLPKASAFVEPLRKHDQLRATLVAYFANDLDAVATAEALHLHPNSLRYRLRRIEELLGRPLRRPSTIAALQLALLGLGDELAEPGDS